MENGSLKKNLKKITLWWNFNKSETTLSNIRHKDFRPFVCNAQAQPSATCILNIALPIRDGCDKF